MANSIYNIQPFQVSTMETPSTSQVYSTLLNLDMSSPTAVIDLKSLANLHRVGNVQGIWMENSAGTTSLSVTMASLQTFTIPAGWQGLAPIYLSADNVLTFTGQGLVGIVLINVPTPV